MMIRRAVRPALAGLVVAVALSGSPASASFHLMQIEQVIAGFCGDTGQQAIQLRMRAGGQNLVSNARLVARDATGANPVVLIAIPSNVSGVNAGDRVLVATAALASTHGVAPDFTFTARIPDTYLTAGRLTFEDDFGTVYWSLAWGGAGYTGSHLGAIDNDADGNFGPAFASGLPLNTASALQFPGAAGAPSTTNAADYAPSANPATLTNNDGDGVALQDCLWGDGFALGTTSAWSAAVP
jgi:hypothetical protein